MDINISPEIGSPYIYMYHDCMLGKFMKLSLKAYKNRNVWLNFKERFVRESKGGLINILVVYRQVQTNIFNFIQSFL